MLDFTESLRTYLLVLLACWALQGCNDHPLSPQDARLGAGGGAGNAPPGPTGGREPPVGNITADSGAPVATPDASDTRTVVRTIAGWPGNVPPGYPPDLCTTFASYYSTSCSVLVSCDLGSTAGLCRKRGELYDCRCILDEEVDLPEPRLGGTGIEPCVQAVETCPL